MFAAHQKTSTNPFSFCKWKEKIAQLQKDLFPKIGCVKQIHFHHSSSLHIQLRVRAPGLKRNYARVRTQRFMLIMLTHFYNLSLLQYIFVRTYVYKRVVYTHDACISIKLILNNIDQFNITHLIFPNICLWGENCQGWFQCESNFS